MSFSDPVGDMLTRIRNGQMRKKGSIKSPSSKLRIWVLDVLKEDGYIRGYTQMDNEKGFKEIEIKLKYFAGDPAIRELKRISKPGRRVYSSVKNLPYVRQGLGVAIVSTAKGVMSDAKAREQNVGGEILCTVF
ncbi:MAG: 30S ribosomal protein S8 [Rhodobacteraceae bacterium]|nr:30S ribosomal protein S8 [Paracoccaceae bacterium]MDE2760995.1 30S ribosomal protein S8 [Paracoccaceae bacterium]MDE2918027.1 30S ribosomal protein S8 [Paracoccaceae bacterium]MYE37721.1 30S ribosomal protein S8 [Paracoccaceae bacterium]MYG42764.1 30S ribosomal protein S8 [Paracoccaceae bacterium]